MGYVTGTDSRQMTLGVWSIEDEVPRDSPARFIEVFVDSLDLEAMGFEHTVPAPTGRPPYNPYDLVKLYVHGYLNKIRSSRRLMRECRRNIELWFLLNRLVPDFRTIADFRKAHRKLLKKIFLIFARACREMKLMDAEMLCLDGTTVRAVNGRKQSTSVELSRKKLEYAKAQLAAVERYLDSMDENDLCEGKIDHPFALDLDKNHLPSVETLKERIAFHEKCLKELEESGRNTMTFTDPESAMMPAKEGGIKACYNVQTAVDAKSHMIADFNITDSPGDKGQLCTSMQMCMKDLELDSVRAIADKGYERRRYQRLPHEQHRSRRGLHPGSGGARVPAGLCGTGYHPGDEGFDEAGGYPDLSPCRDTAGLLPGHQHPHRGSIPQQHQLLHPP